MMHCWQPGPVIWSCCRAEQELAISDEVVGLVEQLEQTTGQFAKSGAGTEADHDRALTELALRRCEQVAS
jgi:hypothetical protein